MVLKHPKTRQAQSHNNTISAQFERVLDLQAEAIMNLSEEELDDEIRSCGLDPDQFGKKAMQVVTDALKQYDQQKNGPTLPESQQ